MFTYQLSVTGLLAVNADHQTWFPTEASSLLWFSLCASLPFTTQRFWGIINTRTLCAYIFSIASSLSLMLATLSAVTLREVPVVSCELKREPRAKAFTGLIASDVFQRAQRESSLEHHWEGGERARGVKRVISAFQPTANLPNGTQSLQRGLCWQSVAFWR